MTETTVLLVPVPEVEHLIDRFRRRLDRTRRQEMPAHVTVLVPFLPASRVDAAVKEQLGAIFATFPRFEFVLRTCNWFERRVLYLEPEPSAPFRAMTLAVAEAFPDYQPYEGAFDEVTPHVTVGEGGRLRKRRLGLRWAARRLGAMPAVRAVAAEVWLMQLDPRTTRWRHRETFPLCGAGVAAGPSQEAPPLRTAGLGG
jgi:hypothetical protein